MLVFNRYIKGMAQLCSTSKRIGSPLFLTSPFTPIPLAIQAVMSKEARHAVEMQSNLTG